MKKLILSALLAAGSAGAANAAAPEDSKIFTPFFDMTPAVFLVSGYAGTFSITLHYDSRVLAREEAGRLLEVYFEEIEKLGIRE